MKKRMPCTAVDESSGSSIWKVDHVNEASQTNGRSWCRFETLTAGLHNYDTEVRDLWQVDNEIDMSIRKKSKKMMMMMNPVSYVLTKN